MKRFLKKLPKVLFLLCFLPWAFILIMGIYCAVFGYESREFLANEVTEIYYGAQGFAKGVHSCLVVFWYLGIILACLVYQGAYLFVKFYLWDKNKNSE